MTTKTTLSKDYLNSIAIEATDFLEFLLKKEFNITSTNEQEDVIFENLAASFNKIFPDADYSNYN